MSRIERFLGVLLLFCAACAFARADVLYTYSYSDTLLHTTFSFVEPTVLTTHTAISPSNFIDVTGPTVTSFDINPTGFTCEGAFYNVPGQQSCTAFVYGGSLYYYPYSTPLTTDNTTYPDGFGSLTIADIAATNVTPEPSSFLLLATGLLAGGAGASWRLRKGITLRA